MIGYLYDIADLVKLEPPIPYTQALEEMLGVDGLLLLQADNCNYQIPPKPMNIFVPGNRYWH